MTNEEKKKNKGWEEMGGYLKTLPFKEACQIWGNENPDSHQDFLNLPHFNADIFKEITGIDVSKTEDKIESEGKLYSITKIKQALNKTNDKTRANRAKNGGVL